MTAALVAGLLAGHGIAVPVGAVGTYLVTLTARTSLRTGSCAALGVATADGLYAVLAALGGSALAGLLRPALGPLRWVSALVLAALAVGGAATALRQYRGHRLATRADPPAPSPARAYLALLGITLLNPTTLVYFAALVLGSRAAHAVPPAEQAVFVLAAFAASASWQLLLAGGGALLGRALTGHRGRLVTALVSSCVITALAVRMLVPPG
ncbi:lysine transporter LysE [Streptomyces sp. NTH33]|uniref:LysE family transporter n=1 Tax=Streptomyces sp. NTH33 TaxID=1735453 RepID=UPI000DA861A4|nr:LysE family transporter [Streptomyces sp. NTH33]PZG93485.1 lysine transporter LysE [Streptomyces sp. NTH33]